MIEIYNNEMMICFDPQLLQLIVNNLRDSRSTVHGSETLKALLASCGWSLVWLLCPDRAIDHERLEIHEPPSQAHPRPICGMHLAVCGNVFYPRLLLRERGVNVVRPRPDQKFPIPGVDSLYPHVSRGGRCLRS